MEAFDVALLVADADMEEADAVDAARAKRGEAPKREATTRRVLALREFASAAKAQMERCQGRTLAPVADQRT